MIIVELVGYCLTALGFAALAALLIFSWRDARISTPLMLASAISAVWGAMAFFVASPDSQALAIVNVLRNGAWLVLLLAILRLAGRSNLVRFSAIFCGLLLLAHAYVESGSAPAVLPGFLKASVLSLLVALTGLFLVEQVYRNARPKDQNNIRFFCTGVGLAFACDLFLYSHELLVGDLPVAGEIVRGYFYAAGVPLIAVAAQRMPLWGVGIFVSRRVVFYSSSLLAIGVYLIVMSSVGYLIQSINAIWGPYLQLAFFSASLVTLIWILFSDQLRATLKVWLHKNFYENKYDYREEWLRLIATLAADPESRPIGVRAIHAMAQIVDSPGGVLWTLASDESCFRAELGLNHEVRATEIAIDHPLVEFLEARRWVVNLEELRASPEKYESLMLDDRALEVDRDSLLVPLQHENRLLGFIELMPGPRKLELNYEDHDLLKTAGQQIASYLEQSRVANLLGESRQFEAFSKFTAFVMHDLKNLIAQQSLMLQNADKHKSNPEFVDDAFQTIANSVRRMQGLLDQLRTRSELGASRRLDLAKLVTHTIELAAGRDPAPTTSGEFPDCQVHADPERLGAVIGHVVRNAQEATRESGLVEVTMREKGEMALIEIRDDGIGMNADFIRDQLFQPFVSTKGSQGMGIGAYQAREYMRALGGDVRVESGRGTGTVFSLSIPLVAQSGA